MPAAAASAPPSIVRSPSRNGPVPRRQTRTATTRAEPARRAHTVTLRLGCALTSTHPMTLRRRQAFPVAAGPRSEECGPEDKLGPGEIGQLLLHGCPDHVPRTARDPLL